MPGVMSTLRSDSDALRKLRTHEEKVWPPPIPFKPLDPKLKKKKADDKSDSRETRAFDVPFSQADTDNTCEFEVPVFEDGHPEEWVKWRVEVEDFFIAANYTTAESQHNVYRHLFKGKAKERFTAAYNKRHTENQALQRAQRQSEETVLAAALNDVARKIFGSWETAARRQKSYMRKNLHMGEQNPEEFADRVDKMNRGFQYFPRADNMTEVSKLDVEEIIDILDHSKKIEWHMTMLAQGKRPESFTTVEDAVDYYKQLYTADILERNLKKPAKAGTKSKKGQEASGEQPPRKKPRKQCPHCKKFGTHSPEECHENPKNKNKRVTFDKASGKKPGLKEAFAIIQQAAAQQQKRGKKRSSSKKQAEDEDLDVFLASLQENMKISDDDSSAE